VFFPPTPDLQSIRGPQYPIPAYVLNVRPEQLDPPLVFPSLRVICVTFDFLFSSKFEKDYRNVGDPLRTISLKAPLLTRPASSMRLFLTSAAPFCICRFLRFPRVLAPFFFFSDPPVRFLTVNSIAIPVCLPLDNVAMPFTSFSRSHARGSFHFIHVLVLDSACEGPVMLDVLHSIPLCTWLICELPPPS